MRKPIADRAAESHAGDIPDRATRIADIRARNARLTHPDWRDTNDVGWLLAELDRTRAALAAAQAADMEPLPARWDNAAVWREEGGAVRVPLTLPGGQPAHLVLEGDEPEILADMLAPVDD